MDFVKRSLYNDALWVILADPTEYVIFSAIYNFCLLACEVSTT